MSEKLCLRWNEFKENVQTAFGRLREDDEFSDVTLVCGDGQQMEAHKVILASSSPLFEKILRRNKGIRDAGSTVDFRILFEIFEILEIFDFFMKLLKI